jgi:hypothetical protein
MLQRFLFPWDFSMSILPPVPPEKGIMPLPHEHLRVMVPDTMFSRNSIKGQFRNRTVQKIPAGKPMREKIVAECYVHSWTNQIISSGDAIQS